MHIFNKYFWKNLYYSQISSRIWPRQRWLTKIIPREYRDKDTLIELVLFKCLSDYVEVEIGKNELFNPDRWSDWDFVSKEQLQFEKELKKYYLLLTVELPRLNHIANIEWNKIPHFNLKDLNNRKDGDYERIYGAVDKAEEDIMILKDLICLWVVNNRKSMWT